MSQEVEGDMVPLGPRLIDDCELPGVGAGNQTGVLCRSKCSQLQSRFSSPCVSSFFTSTHEQVLKNVL